MTLTRQPKLTTSEPQEVTFVELFFDLVFVFAVTQITALLGHDLTLAGVGRSAVVLWLVWWAWTQFTWTLNPADTNHPVVRLVTLVAGGVAFFMAQAVPDAFGDAGAWFAIAYVIVRLLGLSLQVEATWGTPYFAGARIWIGMSTVGLAAVAVGGFVDDGARVGLWIAAVALDLFSAWRAGRYTWNIHADHFAERHGLFVIIALGESLIAAGVAVSGATRDTTFAFGLVAAVVLVSAAWWIYFGSTKTAVHEILTRTPPERVGAVARDLYSFGHLPIVGGIIALALAIEEVLHHPDSALSTETLSVLIAGAALYVGGVAWARLHAERHSVVGPLVTIVVVAGVAIALRDQTGLLVLALVAAALVVHAALSPRTASAE